MEIFVTVILTLSCASFLEGLYREAVKMIRKSKNGSMRNPACGIRN